MTMKKRELAAIGRALVGAADSLEGPEPPAVPVERVSEAPTPQAEAGDDLRCVGAEPGVTPTPMKRFAGMMRRFGSSSSR